VGRDGTRAPRTPHPEALRGTVPDEEENEARDAAVILQDVLGSLSIMALVLSLSSVIVGACVAIGVCSYDVSVAWIRGW